MRREAFTTPGPLVLQLRVPSGRIDVATGDGDQTVVELEALRDDESSISAVEASTVELRERAAGGQEVLVRVASDERGFGFGNIRIGITRSAEVLVRVRAPHGASLDAEAGSADLEAQGRLGSAKVTSGSGDVELQLVEGDVELTTASGDVEVARVAGSAKVSTASGDVQLGAVDGDLTVNSASGDTVVGGAAGGARITSASGDVVVRESTASCVVRTASGDQRIDAVSNGEVSLESASGDIRVGVRRGTKVWLDVRSRSGDASSDLDVGDDPPPEGGPTLELRASSMSGDVHVARAS